MITDWDDAYANRPYIPGGDDYPPRWSMAAQAFRDARPPQEIAYGAAPRQRLDLFRPDGPPRGLFVFVHGGYWISFDKSVWSHFAAGALARGWAVALPGYTLAPQARVAEITREVAAAIARAAAEIAGPVRLAGHSAGGHLVTRALCRDSTIPPDVAARVEQVVSVSGVHDLRPLMRTKMNASLRLDEAEAGAESPALLRPREGVELVCWVGTAERPEFLRQNDLLANVWTGLGARTRAVHAKDRHHFDVIDDLADPSSELARLCAP